jgi:hypothetical protein
VPHFVDAPWKVVFILRDHSHHSPDDTGFCEHCGQPLPATRLPSYGEKRTNRVGIGITVALHLLLVIVYLFQPKMEKHATPPSKGEIVYIAPLATKPKQKESAKASKPVKVKTAPVQMKRLPNTITLPHEKPVEVVKEPSKEAPKETPKPPAPEVDMMAAIEAKRAARGATQSTQPAEETASERGNRLAKANIAAANGKSRGNDDSESGGMFELTNRTYHSADVKFRTFNPNFKRRWLKTVTVEQGSEVDLETAIVKKMIAMIREERTGDIDWDSHRQQRIVKLSARIEDTAELTAFLMSEMFPEHRVVRR